MVIRADRRTGKKKEWSWEEIESYFYAELGRSPDEWRRTTFRELMLMIEGNKRKQSRDMEHTRLICWHIAAPNWDPKKVMPSIEKFMPLPTDEKVEPMTEDKYKAIFQTYIDKGHLKPINE